MLVVHEAERHDNFYREAMPWINPASDRQFRIQNANYMAVLRFILTDPAHRRFTPERFCFRGSVDDWINIGPPAPLAALLKNTSNI